jgi:hypothetical protein
MSRPYVVAGAALCALVLASGAAEAGGYFVQVTWCGGQTYRIRESSGSTEATVNPRGITTAHTNDIETSQRRVVVDRKLAWGSSLRARRVQGAHVLDWVDRPSGEPQELVGLRVVYVPALSNIRSMSALAAELRDHAVTVLITDVGDYKRAESLISTTKPRRAIIAMNPNEERSKTLIANYPKLSTVQSGETRQGVSVTNNEAMLSGGLVRVTPLAVLSEPTVRCEGIDPDGGVVEPGASDGGVSSAPSGGASLAPVNSASALGAGDDRRAQRDSAACRCDAPGGHRPSRWSWVASLILVVLARRGSKRRER